VVILVRGIAAEHEVLAGKIVPARASAQWAGARNSLGHGGFIRDVARYFTSPGEFL
jgi:hypothetical protein